jgi:hypothetical protein
MHFLTLYVFIIAVKYASVNSACSPLSESR